MMMKFFETTDLRKGISQGFSKLIIGKLSGKRDRIFLRLSMALARRTDSFSVRSSVIFLNDLLNAAETTIRNLFTRFYTPGNVPEVIIVIGYVLELILVQNVNKILQIGI